MRPGFINSFQPSRIVVVQESDPLWDKVVFDLAGEGPSPTDITDASGYGRPVQVFSGTPRSWSPACSDGAALFAGGWGTGSLTSILTSASPINLGSGDFTIEGWVNFFSTPQENAGTLLGQGVISFSDFSFSLGYSATTSQWFFSYAVGAGNVSQTLAGGPAAVVGTWYHVCAERTGGTLRLYVNGSIVASGGIAGSIFFSPVRSLFVGGFNPGGTNQYFNGTASGVRVTTAARYDGTFTPDCPVSGGADPLWANTVLFMPFDSAAGLSDISTSSRSFAVTGPVSVLTVPCGTRLLLLSNGGVDARRAALGVPYPEARVPMGSSDFTVEAYIRFQTAVPVGAAPTILSQAASFGLTTSAGTNSPVDEAFAFLFNKDTNELRFIFNRNGTADRTVANASWSPSHSTWYHVAVSRSGDNLLLFVDGMLLSTTPVIGSMFNSSQRMGIGVGGPNNSLAMTTLHGAIDGLRIYRGVAKYTASFVPTCSLPAPEPPAGAIDIVAATGYGQVTFADFVDSGRTWRAMGIRHYRTSAARPIRLLRGLDAASTSRKLLHVAAIGYGGLGGNAAGGLGLAGGGGAGGWALGAGDASTLSGVNSGQSLLLQRLAGNLILTTSGAAVTVQAGGGGDGGAQSPVQGGGDGGDSLIVPPGSLSALGAGTEQTRGAGGGGGAPGAEGTGGSGGTGFAFGVPAPGGNGGNAFGGGAGGGGGTGNFSIGDRGGDGIAGANIGGGGGGSGPALPAFYQTIIAALQLQDSTWSRVAGALGGGGGGGGAGGAGAGGTAGGGTGGASPAGDATKEGSGSGPNGTAGSAVLLLCWPLTP